MIDSYDIEDMYNEAANAFWLTLQVYERAGFLERFGIDVSLANQATRPWQLSARDLLRE